MYVNDCHLPLTLQDQHKVKVLLILIRVVRKMTAKKCLMYMYCRLQKIRSAWANYFTDIKIWLLAAHVLNYRPMFCLSIKTINFEIIAIHDNRPILCRITCIHEKILQVAITLNYFLLMRGRDLINLHKEYFASSFVLFNVQWGVQFFYCRLSHNFCRLL